MMPIVSIIVIVVAIVAATIIVVPRMATRAIVVPMSRSTHVEGGREGIAPFASQRTLSSGLAYLL